MGGINANKINQVYDIAHYVYKNRIEAFETINRYHDINLEFMDLNDIYSEICWIIYNSGFKYEIVLKYWPYLINEYHNFDVQIMSSMNDIDNYAHTICSKSGFNNLNKAKWCIYNSRRLLDLDNALFIEGGLIKYFLNLKEKDLIELIEDMPSIINFLKLKGIGKITIFHLLKNLGFDIFKPDIHLTRILSSLKLISDQYSYNEIAIIMKEISSLMHVRIRDLDTILFFYGKITDDSLSDNC